MKYTLLGMTQTILARMDSQEINSISDTTEARQVAQIIRTAYFNILNRANMPEHKKTFNLTASADSAFPTLMYRPDNVTNIEWIQYMDTSTGDNVYQYVTILPVQQYVDLTKHLNDSTDTTIDTFNLEGVDFFYKNDQQPRYCTFINNYNIVFDGYDSVIDSTLQSSKTLAYGLIVPTFDLADSFVPDLDDFKFPLLLNEATSQAFLELKQIANDQAVRDARRQWVSLQRDKDVSSISHWAQLPSFGRT